MARAKTLIVIACVSMLAIGCQSKRGAVDAPADGLATVTGRLVSVKDDRPVDGGIDLTIETESGKRELLRVGSAFIAGPREPVLALQAVADSAKAGDRLRASGRRDPSGALMVERLEILE